MGRGGLACLVGKSHKYKIRDDIDIWIEDKTESLSLEMNVIRRKILFILIYKPSSVSFKDFKHGFESLINMFVWRF